jgi:hypothetical protein
MWCAIQVALDDDRSLWLTDADSRGVRSVDEFKNAAIFWRREHAQAAIDLFCRRNGEKARQLAIVEVGQEIWSEQSKADSVG